MASRIWSMPSTVMAARLAECGRMANRLARAGQLLYTSSSTEGALLNAGDIRVAAGDDVGRGERPGRLSDAPDHPDRALRGRRLDRSRCPRAVGGAQGPLQPTGHRVQSAG